MSETPIRRTARGQAQEDRAWSGLWQAICAGETADERKSARGRGGISKKAEEREERLIEGKEGGRGREEKEERGRRKGRIRKGDREKEMQ